MSLSVWRRDPAPTAPDTRRFTMARASGHTHELDFTGFRPATVDPAPEPPRRRASLDALKARIRRYNAELDPASETFRAAVILLAAYADGQNVDALARRTGFGRAFVSKCARRLIDNGVWAAGRTVAEWSPEDEASGAFWNDVAVAEGKLCRRIVEGRIEWAPAGFWNKRYDFVSQGDAPLSAVYHDAAAEPDHAAIGTADAAADEARPQGVSNGSGPALPTESTVGAGPNGGTEESEPAGHGGRADRPASTTAQLFPDAVWLG